MSFIETSDRTRLFCKEWGTGATALFVHSWALSVDMWQYQMEHLAERGVRCLAYDQRGHGRSSDPGRGYDYDTLADDLAVVIERLDLRGITLIGHSMGCGEIVRYLSRHGTDHVARVALLAPMTPYMLKTADNPAGVEKTVFEMARAAWRKDFPKWAADNAYTFFAPETSPAMVAWGLKLFLQTSLKAAIGLNHAVTETDFWPELPTINVPTLIIHGDADMTAPLDLTGRRSVRLIPDSQLIVYEGAPHGLMFSHTERLNGDLLAFIQG